MSESIQMSRCYNCEELWPVPMLKKLEDPNSFNPAEAPPLGRCPKCGTLCYYFNPHTYYTPDANGQLCDNNGRPIECANVDCEAGATVMVLASRNRPCDSFRCYCYSCHDVYMVGVQHGRHHEAERFAQQPSRQSSQEYPHKETNLE